MPAHRRSAHNITELPEIVARLSVDDATRFNRIYAVDATSGRMLVPDSMAPWVERVFGTVGAVETQRLMRVSNLVTGEGSLFNELRALRPVRRELMTEYDISTELERDPWESPLEATPEDVFGRLSNDFAVTASNVAKYDSLHGIIVFKEPNPLVFNRYSVRGYVELAARWFREAHRANPDSVYPFFLWNCLWRAGSSIVHGHAQVQIAKGRHYAKVEGMRRAALAYRHAYGASYFEDLSAVHGTIGLRYRAGPVDVLVNLTPTKEKEILLIAPAFDEALADAVVDVLSVFRDRLGVRSFNVGVQLPALGTVEESWQGFPVLARIVDRGDLLTRTSDFGGMELFAEAVVASDPFVVMDALIGAGR